jgi:hypothetical protein
MSPAAPLTAPPNSDPNPYVGPRAFRPGESLFGRERETDELLDLLLAERVVLLHSQSGAGKSSLINAALIPRLVDEGFEVLPPVRVSRTVPANAPEANRYVRSVLLDLEMAGAESEPRASLTLDAYFSSGSADGKPQALILDQFEELLTLDVTDLGAKAEFCRQLGLVLQDRNRWALVAMRDEYIGALAPFLHLLPTRLANRYRLELLSPDAARDSIKRPAEALGVSYSDAAVNRLVEDLRRVRQQTSPNTVEERPGPFIEPVHLQVVCTNLWRRLLPGTKRVEEADVAGVGDVDSALGSYYSAAVAAAAAAGGSPERSVREFIGDCLIIEGVRSQTLAGNEQEFGVTAASMRALENSYVIRREERRGGIWYELAHDRLIRPLQRDNAIWKEKNDPQIVKLAEEWERNGRPNRLLLLLTPQRSVGALLDANRRRSAGRDEAKAVQTAIRSPTVQAYLKASARLQKLVSFGAVALAAVLVVSAYSFSKFRENVQLRTAMDSLQQVTASLRRATDSLTKATDSAQKVSNVFYERAWGLQDTSRSKVMASVEANRVLQQAVQASPKPARGDITVDYYYKRTDPQRVEYALKELGYQVTTRPARAEDLSTNAISYGGAVPLSEVRVIALAIARTGATLRRICPFRNQEGRERSVAVIGSASAQQLPALDVKELYALGSVAQLQCEFPRVSSSSRPSGR